MDGKINLYQLTKEQLVNLVQVRGQAIEFHSLADQRLFEKIENDDIQDGDFQKFMTAKVDILSALMTAEEAILNDGKPPLAN